MMTLFPWETPPVSSMRDMVLRPARTRRTEKTDKEFATGVTGSGTPASAGDRRDGQASDRTQGEPDVGRDATTGGLARQGGSWGF
jgi:hypothetical protein